MANKQVNELSTITGVLDQDDYILVYDSDEAGAEKLKKRPISGMNEWYLVEEYSAGGGTASKNFSISNSAHSFKVVYAIKVLDTSDTVNLGFALNNDYTTSNYINNTGANSYSLLASATITYEDIYVEVIFNTYTRIALARGLYNKSTLINSSVWYSPTTTISNIHLHMYNTTESRHAYGNGTIRLYRQN